MFLDVLPRDGNLESISQGHRQGLGGTVDFAPSRSNWPFPVAASREKGVRSDGVDTAMSMKADACAASSFVT